MFCKLTLIHLPPIKRPYESKLRPNYVYTSVQTRTVMSRLAKAIVGASIVRPVA